MFKSKAISGNNFKFKVKPMSRNGRDKLTYFIGKELDMVPLFIDDAKVLWRCNIIDGRIINGW